MKKEMEPSFRREGKSSAIEWGPVVAGDSSGGTSLKNGLGSTWKLEWVRACAWEWVSEQNESSWETDWSRAGFQGAHLPFSAADAHRLGNSTWGGRLGRRSPRGGSPQVPHSVSGRCSFSWAARSSELFLLEGNSARSYAWGLSSLIIKLGQYLIYDVNTWHITMKYLNTHVLKANSIPTCAS